jgi:integrase
VLSPEEVGRLLEAAPGPGLKYKAALSIAYGAGLRAGEVVMLRVGDIDSKRMLIRVEQGKGRKDRHAMLSPQLLELLRAWWRQCRSPGWLFPGRDPLLPVTRRACPSRRQQGLRRLPGAAEENQVVRLRQAPLILAAGTVHTFASASISFHSADRTSLERPAVRIANSTTRAVTPSLARNCAMNAGISL